ncbi:MAG TPA: hypothetical protein PL140_03655 [Ferrovaceae bacterium]|jgi:hypothetical protein|nr:hypothetical protein [Ferrovaceae bacterium]HQU06327.1 hypothetical protein [Ferrovaceae bacterium]
MRTTDGVAIDLSDFSLGLLHGTGHFTFTHWHVLHSVHPLSHRSILHTVRHRMKC